MEATLSSPDEPLSALAATVLDDATAAFPRAAALAQRCLRFSHGYHARALLALLDQFLTGDAAGRLALAVRAARRRCRSLGGGQAAATSRGPSPVPGAGAEAAAAAAGAFDWDDLQVGVSLTGRRRRDV